MQDHSELVERWEAVITRCNLVAWLSCHGFNLDKEVPDGEQDR